jgi:hypothetical protein
MALRGAGNKTAEARMIVPGLGCDVHSRKRLTFLDRPTSEFNLHHIPND